MSTANESYWAEYDGLQQAKHQLLRSYLNAWFPILSSWQGRVLYLDCHAGRGRHETGHEGSPILALNLLLRHRSRDRILASTEVHFMFYEKDRRNYDALCSEIASLGQLPSNVLVSPQHTDYESTLRQVIQDMRARGKNLAPAFAFVDPFGFTLSMDLLNDLLRFPACELFVNLMYRYVDMAICLPSQEGNMDVLFGCSNWRSLRNIEDADLRAQGVINLFASQLGAKYVTHMHMRATNGTLKYVLLHATNHRR